jgi:thymidylate synthase (FAD)
MIGLPIRTWKSQRRDWASQAAHREMADRLAEKFKGIGDRTWRRKKSREAARSVLPNATETKIFVTANARALRHFIEMRGDAAADVEIRRLALAVLELLQHKAPNLFGDYPFRRGEGPCLQAWG